MDGPDGEMNIDRVVMGMASQLSEREDHLIVEDLRGTTTTFSLSLFGGC